MVQINLAAVRPTFLTFGYSSIRLFCIQEITSSEIHTMEILITKFLGEDSVKTRFTKK